MKRGPITASARNGDGSSMLEKARAAWDSPTPDWIEELARLADAHGLRGAGRRIGYSPSTVSEVLRGVFKGSMPRVEEMVRGALMGAEVDCQILGTIGRDQCLDWQRKPFAPTNATRVQVFHACRGGCPHARNGGDDGAAQ
ncbi:MAG TPA: transcriptional regulator [Hyphomicrobiales bacterium]|nr:transcriptional regulator [Hyphomicrobiales bacterium]